MPGDFYKTVNPILDDFQNPEVQNLADEINTRFEVIQGYFRNALGNIITEDDDGVYVSGKIIGTSGSIGGFNIGEYDIWGGHTNINDPTTTIVLGNLDGTSKLALGASADALTVAGGAAGFIVDGDGKFYCGDASTNFIKFDGTDLTVSGSITVTGGNAVVYDTDQIEQTDGTVINLDEIDDGTSWGRVATTAITGGKILLTGDGVSGSLAITYTDADVTADESQDLSWLDGTQGTLTLSSTGKLEINAGGALEIQAAGGINVLAGGKFDAGDGGTEFIKYDGTDLTVSGSITVTGGNAVVYDTDQIEQTDGTVINLDEIDDGTSWGRVATTAITGGKIVLSSGTGVDGSLPVGNTDADVTSDNSQAVAWLTDAGALATGDDIDDVPDSATYGRVQIGSLDGGYVDLLRMSADTTERLLVTASGIEGYANNVKNFELASGIAYLGDQSNEHIKLSSSGLEIYDNETVLATYGSTVIIGQVGENLSNIEITSGALNLRTNEVDVISISNAGVAAISILAGGDITLVGDDTSSAILKWDGTKDISMGANEAGSAFGIWPEDVTGSTTTFGIGYKVGSGGSAQQRFHQAYMAANDGITIDAWNVSNTGTALSLTNASVSMVMTNALTTKSILQVAEAAISFTVNEVAIGNFSSTALTIDGNIIVTGTVDGVDIASWIDQDVSSGANVTFGTIGCGTITVANGSSISLQEDITFTGATTVNQIKFPDAIANALSFMEGANIYQQFVTTNGSEAVYFAKPVGIGTAGPTRYLHVYGADDTVATFESTDANVYIQLKDNASGTGGEIQVVGDIMYLRTANVQAVTIDASQNVGIGIVPDTDVKLDVEQNYSTGFAASFFNDGNDNDRFGIRIQCGPDDTSADVAYFTVCNDGNGNEVGGTRDITGTFGVYQGSDITLKTDVIATSINCLSLLKKLVVYDFNWASSRNPGFDFVAQQMQEYFPQLVAPMTSGKLGITKDGLIQYIVKGIQEEDKKVEEQKEIISYFCRIFETTYEDALVAARGE